MEDGDETTRESSYETFATLSIVLGERTLQGITVHQLIYRSKFSHS